MRRNLELENWLIETTGEEMMANHLGPNWKRFNEDIGFYPNMTMTVADQVWQHQQSKVDELQRRNQMLNDNIKEQGQKLVYQNEVIETQAEKLLGLRNKNAELQKRIDGIKKIIREACESDGNSSVEIVFDEVEQLEQALKGGGLWSEPLEEDVAKEINSNISDLF